jgi:hypothetical protein
MTTHRLERSKFRIVESSIGDDAIKIFCGHCGRQPEEPGASDRSRVCETCGMGLLLQANASVAPTPTDPFLVVDRTLAICAVSRQAERLLSIVETEVVNRHISELLVPADADPGADGLATALIFAARGEATPGNAVVRPANAFGVRYWARIAQCGPTPAALVVLADA